MTSIPLWQRIELSFTFKTVYSNPLQDAALVAQFTTPSGKTHRVPGFWDGDMTWKVRFAPDEIGRWTYLTTCTDTHNQGLHAQSGELICREPAGNTRFEQHGPIRVTEDHRYFIHADGTPFLWMADTAWNGPLHSTDSEWAHYVNVRKQQRFSAVQWIATQWLASPYGDRHGNKAYTGNDRITINPTFFQRLDRKIDAINAAGMLAVPTLLWAAAWSPDAELNAADPGYALPEDQAILLARYIVARWGAHAVAWLLNGDGIYAGEHAAKWQRIGRAVFGDIDHAPVTLHPTHMYWLADDLEDEDWIDFIGYQSGHGDDQPTTGWLVEGPPSEAWRCGRPRPIINLEPAYENHVAFHSLEPFSAHDVRNRLYWSLLVSPTAGVSYGGHGVWGWDDGTRAPLGHPDSGTPLPWQDALHMVAAEHVQHLIALFESIRWWTLRPCTTLVKQQAPKTDNTRFIAAACSASGDLALVYIPQGGQVALDLSTIQVGLHAEWIDPRTGERLPAHPDEHHSPSDEDWLLLFSQGTAS